ncbi:MAG: glycosyltransferase [Cytophagaceae bacterium]|jgi:uncharacterized protein (TIGR00661 family)|nr:glycosyltransferase [Cytophagaceae bacterium]
MKESLRFLFIVQGEGRGHMTQAISLRDLLIEHGHEVAAVLVGKSERRQIPEFFTTKIQAPVIPFDSPNFITDKQGKGIRLGATLWQNSLKMSKFLAALKQIDEQVKIHQPDIIINFYDLLAGLYQAFYKPTIPSICVGHQYLLLHPDFKFPRKKFLERTLVKLNTQVTAMGAVKKLGLSFRPMKDASALQIKVVPPLLRNELFDLHPQTENFILAYMVNSGYADEIIEWHKNNPGNIIHCFWDRKDLGPSYTPMSGITFHQLDDQKFLDFMRRCRAYVSTAGFESICEAMFLGKPVMMIPTKGQFEQECNALDAIESKAGISHHRFDFSILLKYLPQHHNESDHFRNWVHHGSELIVQEIEQSVLSYGSNSHRARRAS